MANLAAKDNEDSFKEGGAQNPEKEGNEESKNVIGG